jgi:hypothetical protein
MPSLQKLCGSQFGWPASKTLAVAQELYDGQGKKIITYPRAEVRYLSQSLISDVPRIVAGLQVDQSAQIFWLRNRDPAHWRDAWQLGHLLGKYVIADRPLTEDDGGMSWRETPDGDCAFCQTLYRDDVVRFYEDKCSTCAWTTKERLGACSSDAAARAAVEKALGGGIALVSHLGK